ncbi:hypothetical protein HDV05_006963 [Chytridiales sp. JEL 0842]|nr:hypothetical protein HDV05_006963 [Chytridiales sp. JEL 0842]
MASSSPPKKNGTGAGAAAHQDVMHPTKPKVPGSTSATTKGASPPKKNVSQEVLSFLDELTAPLPSAPVGPPKPSAPPGTASSSSSPVRKPQANPTTMDNLPPASDLFGGPTIEKAPAAGPPSSTKLPPSSLPSAIPYAASSVPLPTSISKQPPSTRAPPATLSSSSRPSTQPVSPVPATTDIPLGSPPPSVTTAPSLATQGQPPSTSPQNIMQYNTRDSGEEPSAPSTTQDQSSWSWNTLWSTAQATASKVTAATASSITMAQHLVEEVEKTVSAEKVKGIVANVSNNVSHTVKGVVNTEAVGKLGSELMKSVNTIGDIIAPPIQRGPSANGRRGIGADIFSGDPLPPMASTVTVWLCAQTLDPEAINAGSVSNDTITAASDQIHDFVQGTTNALWLESSSGQQQVCEKIVVNSVTDPTPRGANGLDEALKEAEKTLKRLSKLAESTSPTSNAPPTTSTSSPTATSHTMENVTLFLVVQPFTISATSEIFGTVTARQFVTVLYKAPSGDNKVGARVSTAVSQSVGLGGQKSDLLVRWTEDQVVRVVESVVTDVLEEYALKLQLEHK